MKKVWLLALALALAIFAAGCSDNADDDAAENNDANTEQTDDAAKSDNKEADVKTALIDFQLNLVDVLKKNNGAIVEYSTAKGNEEATEEEVEAARQAAEEASKTVAEEVRAFEVPENVGDYQDQLAGAIDSLAQSYEKRAEGFAKDGSEAAIEEADTLFADFESQLETIYKDAGLIPPSIKAELE